MISAESTKICSCIRVGPRLAASMSQPTAGMRVIRRRENYTYMKPAIAVLLFASTALCQSRIPFVRATGNGSVNVQPDQGKIVFSVVTQASTAQAAATQNASLVATVLSQLTALLGPTADIR